MIVWEPAEAVRFPLDVRAVRAYVVGAAGAAGGVDLEDVELMVSELVTNAGRYTASGRPGGGVSVRVLAGPGVRVEIEDDGGAATRPELRDGGSFEESGRGLVLVDAMADRWGYREAQGRVTVWFEVDAGPSPLGMR